MGACMLLGGKHIDKNSTLKKTKIVMAIPFDNIPQKDILMVEKEVNKIVERSWEYRYNSWLRLPIVKR